jgi:hypothetical protein
LTLGTAIFSIFVVFLLIRYRWARMLALGFMVLCVLLAVRISWVENHHLVHEAGCINGYKPDPRPKTDEELRALGDPLVPCE